VHEEIETDHFWQYHHVSAMGFDGFAIFGLGAA
jgi:hypothetical protein